MFNSMTAIFCQNMPNFRTNLGGGGNISWPKKHTLVPLATLTSLGKLTDSIAHVM